jgi:hypothetical protein
MDDSTQWFLMKQSDGSVFGPLTFNQLHQWAIDAYIAPLDKISNDQINWVKAPMIPGLHMDYLVELEPGTFYGPTTIGAIREFVNGGEITQDAPLTDCRTGEQKTFSEFAGTSLSETSQEIIRVSARENLQTRIRELEEALLKERQQRKTMEELRVKAEIRIAELEELLGI